MNSYLDMRWFEDFEVGQVFEFGTFEMTRQNMLDYARLYDPEPKERGRRKNDLRVVPAYAPGDFLVFL